MTRRRLPVAARAELLAKLEARFAAHQERHDRIDWNEVAVRLEGAGPKLWSLGEMERTGGEPDVVGRDEATGELLFADCSAESPGGRRNVCYDREAQESRKDGLGRANAVDMAHTMGIEILTEDEYRHLQTLGRFDAKTTSWLDTPAEIRRHGGAVFGQLRFEHVFVCPNGAQSFYGSRGFRGSLRV